MTSDPAAARHEQVGRLADRTGPTTLAADQLLPVLPAVAGLLPDGGLRRGTVVVVAGSPRLALALLAGPTRAGHWAAAVGGAGGHPRRRRKAMRGMLEPDAGGPGGRREARGAGGPGRPCCKAGG